MSTQTLVTFAFALVVLAGFVAWELRVKEPMLDLRFFRNPRFTAATTAITLVFFAMFGSYFIFTQYLQFVRGYDPLERRRSGCCRGRSPTWCRPRSRRSWSSGSGSGWW